MDGVRCSNREITELDSFRLLSYDQHQQRMLACTGATQLSTMERVGGDDMWEPSGGWQVPCAGHVTELAWAPSHFGPVVAASCSDGQLFIYAQQPLNRVTGAPPDPHPKQDGPSTGAQGPWVLKYRTRCGPGPIAGLQFGPRHLGLWLAVGGQDGFVRLYNSPDVLDPGHWTYEQDIPTGSPVTCLTWRSHAPEQQGVPPVLLVGTAANVALWVYNEPLNTWQPTGTASSMNDPEGTPGPLAGPQGTLKGPITAVAWAPTLGRPVELLAAACGTEVHVFSCQGAVNALQVQHVAALEHNAVVWKVEWNMLGNWLATGTEDGLVHLWRPALSGEWRRQNAVVPEQ